MGLQATCIAILLVESNTMEPPNQGHIGTRYFVICTLSEVDIEGVYCRDVVLLLGVSFIGGFAVITSRVHPGDSSLL